MPSEFRLFEDLGCQTSLASSYMCKSVCILVIYYHIIIVSRRKCYKTTSKCGMTQLFCIIITSSGSRSRHLPTSTTKGWNPLTSTNICNPLLNLSVYTSIVTEIVYISSLPVESATVKAKSRKEQQICLKTNCIIKYFR